MISNKKKALLHVAKSELGLTDEIYREVVLKHTGMTSCADPNFTDLHFKEVIDHFKLVYNFQVKSKFHQQYRRDPDALPSPEHLRKLDHVIADFSQFEPQAARREFQRGFNARVIKRPWPQTRKEVNKMIEAWAARLRRAEAKARKEISRGGAEGAKGAKGFVVATAGTPPGGSEPQAGRAYIVYKGLAMKVSLRLILIAEDDGKGQNVRPLAQQEILETEMAEGDAKLFLIRASIATQKAIKTLATLENRDFDSTAIDGAKGFQR